MAEPGMPPPEACWSTDRRTARQSALLEDLVGALVPDNRFYTQKLQAAGLEAGTPNLVRFLEAMPFTTREEWTRDQEEHPPYGTNLTYSLNRYTHVSRTSGTTGTPRTWLDTPQSWEAMLANWERVYRSAGVDDSSTVLFAFSFGPFLGFWTAYDAGVRLGALCIPSGGFSSEARLQLMAETCPDTLCCTPTYALHLGQVAAQTEILKKARPAEAGLKRIIVAGEPGGSLPATRDRISSLWNGAAVIDHHGMTEVGPVTYQCPAEPGILHVMEHAFLAEVIEPDGTQPVAPGTEGELVLTTLQRQGMPLLRYRTGDRVQADRRSPCACGSTELRLQGGIRGRTDDMVIIRGVNIFPSAVDQIMRSIPEITEYEVQVLDSPALNALTIRVETTAGDTSPASVAEAAQRRMRDAFAVRIPVTAVPANTLPRYEFKARRWRKTEAPHDRTA